jgi:hypothetical protein
MGSDVDPATAEARSAYYRGMFVAAAIWNLISAACVIFALTKPSARAELGFPGTPDAIALQLLAGCLFVFGLGYYWVSQDLTRNRDIVKLGVAGKPLVFLVFAWHAFMKDISMMLLLPSVVDLLFGALFLEFLLRTREGLR